MPLLSKLLDKLPEHTDLHMSANGHILWICWTGSLPPAISQTLQNYGGMFITQSDNQALWFFFSTDVFMALGRLAVWGSFNEMPVTMELFHGSLQLSTKRQINLGIDMALRHQELMPDTHLEIWVHPRCVSRERDFPGITLEKARTFQGMALAEWLHLKADPRMPYASTQGWYAVLHPLGSPLDKKFQAGWKSMFARLEPLHTAQKLKVQLSQNFLIVNIDNLVQLRSWLSDVLLTCQDVKNNNHDAYWPCVIAVIDRKGIAFTSEVPFRVGLQWDRLMPDFPYVNYRNAYLLGPEFAIQDLRFSGDHANMESWCNVGLGENVSTAQAIPLLMSSQLLAGEGEACFHCGLQTHSAEVCPTRAMPEYDGEVQEQFSHMGLDDINKGFRTIEHALQEHGMDGYATLFSGDETAALLLHAVFEITAMFQLRQCRRQWLTMLREFNRSNPADIPVKQDDSPVWDLLEKLEKADPESLSSLERKLRELIAQNPRDARLRTLLGFTLVEKHDMPRAVDAFRDAANVASSLQHQAWNDLLAGRVLETSGNLPEALEQYARVQRMAPQWQENTYRQIICKVKMGFTDHILGDIMRLIDDDPHYFNRFIIDPESGPGRLIILTSLYPEWQRMEQRAKVELENVQNMASRLKDWFAAGHPMGDYLGVKVEKLHVLANISNYQAHCLLIQERPQLEKEIDERIQREVEELQERYRMYLDALQHIRDEASWFPFPSILHQFSREFNEAAGLINWAFACNFGEATTFQRAHQSTSHLNDLLFNLKKRLKFLRMVRDTTLFSLTLCKGFIWMELAGLVFCFAAMPLLAYFGEGLGLIWLQKLMERQQWEIQKVLLLIVSLVALGIAALRTTLVFDRKRDKLLNEAKAQREKLQEIRLNRIKRQRAAEAETALRVQQEEEKRLLQQRMRS